MKVVWPNADVWVSRVASHGYIRGEPIYINAQPKTVCEK